MKCINCFEEISDDAKLCSFCGFGIEEYAPAPYHLPPQTVIGGRYIAGRVIGEGGFGITYKACDTVLGVKYAIKEYYPAEISGRGSKSEDGNTIFPFAGEEESFAEGLERFEREARRMTEFDGLAGIVNVKDYFSENGTGYIVMEYAEGISLESYLESKGGRIPLSEAMDIVKPVILSLARVHSRGIIHRDISPDNIMLTEKNGAVLIDFGAARQFDSDKSLSVIIKYGYAPYEQYGRHGKQGPWTDVYAMCGVIYRMVTGERPPDAIARIQGESELLEMKKSDPSVTPSRERAIKMGLEAKAANRLQNMEQLYEALYNGNFNFPKNPDVKSEQSPSKKKRSLPKAAVIAAAAVLVIGGGAAIIGLNNSSHISEGIETRAAAGTENAETAADETMESTTSAPAETEGAYRIILPDLTGLSAEEAEKILKPLNLTVKRSYKEDSTAAKDSIVIQQPAAGESASEGEEIEVFINTLETVQLPKLTELSIEKACEQLDDLGLNYEILTAPADSGDPDVILSQSIEEGEYTVPGNTVTLHVSSAKPPMWDKTFDYYEAEIKTGTPNVFNVSKVLASVKEYGFFEYIEIPIEGGFNPYYMLKGSYIRNNGTFFGVAHVDFEAYELLVSVGFSFEDSVPEWYYIEEDFDNDGKDEYYVLAQYDLDGGKYEFPSTLSTLYYTDDNGDWSIVMNELNPRSEYEGFSYEYDDTPLYIIDYGDYKHLYWFRTNKIDWSRENVFFLDKHIDLYMNTRLEPSFIYKGIGCPVYDYEDEDYKLEEALSENDFVLTRDMITDYAQNNALNETLGWGNMFFAWNGEEYVRWNIAIEDINMQEAETIDMSEHQPYYCQNPLRFYQWKNGDIGGRREETDQ